MGTCSQNTFRTQCFIKHVSCIRLVSRQNITPCFVKQCLMLFYAMFYRCFTRLDGPLVLEEKQQRCLSPTCVRKTSTVNMSCTLLNMHMLLAYIAEIPYNIISCNSYRIAERSLLRSSISMSPC